MNGCGRVLTKFGRKRCCHDLFASPFVLLFYFIVFCIDKVFELLYINRNLRFFRLYSTQAVYVQDIGSHIMFRESVSKAQQIVTWRIHS